MEAFNFSRVSPLTKRWGNSGENPVWTSWRSSPKAEQCSGIRTKRKNYVGVVAIARLVGVPLGVGSLLQLRRSESGNSTRCRTNDKSHASVALVVSDEEIESHRKELLDRYLVDGFETEIGGDDEEEEEEGREIDDDKSPEGRDEAFFRRRATTGPRLHTMVRWEEASMENQPEKKFWGMNVDIKRMITPHTRGIVLLNILTFLYGSNISIIKSAGTSMDPSLFTFGRFFIASMVFSPFLTRALTKKTVRNAGVELGLLASSGYLTQCISVLTSDAARVSFISTFTVIVVPLFAGLAGAKINRITWFAAAAALVGVGLLESNGTPFAVGDVWSFVSAVMFGVHMLRTEHHSNTLYPEDSLPIMALQLAVITMSAALWSCGSHLNSGDVVIDVQAWNWPTLWEKTSVLPWLPMLYTGLLSTAFCLWSELVSLRDVKATEAAVIYTMEPLWGAAFAWITLGERWGPNGWLGACFILGGSLTMQLFGHCDTTPLKKVALLPSSHRTDRVDSSAEEDFEFDQSEGSGR